MRFYEIQERVLGRILDEKAQANWNRVFLQFTDQEITYHEFKETVDRVAKSLDLMGVKKGDKVSIMLPNCPEFLYMSFALAKIGAVSVPVNTAFKGDILQYIIDNSDSEMLVVDERFLERIEFVQNRLGKLKRILIRSPNRHAVNSLAFEATSFASLLESRPECPEADVKHSDLLSIMYTSGTTGPSKGVMVPHCQACTFALDWINVTGYTSQDILYTPLPLFHVVGSFLGVVPVLITNSRIVIAESFSASRWWGEMRKYHVTVAHCLTSMMNILLSRPETPDDKNHNVRAFYMGGSSLDTLIRDRFGPTVLEPYGATESGLPLLDRYGEHKPGTCGKENSDHFEVKIVDENDNELPPGEKGELVIRPKEPYVMMMGYYKMPEVTINAFRNLWFHSGDRLYRNHEGYFYFVDRMKEVIRRRGENISSYEVEKVVNSHPSVVESAAIPVTSKIGEEEIKICVVVKDGQSLSYEELIGYCEDRMPNFWIPRYIEFKQSLPKTETEKIQKYVLRSEGRGGITDTTWDREVAGYKLKKK